MNAFGGTGLTATRCGVVAACGALCMGLAAVAGATPPDLTDPATVVDTKLSYNLGPTGMRGWIFYQKPDAAPVMTRDSRQILVTGIDAGSPADGVLRVGDVIVGVNGGLFTTDCRKSFGVAIGEAEKTENNGVLNLRVWRAGTTSNMNVQLAVMGSYSATAPYNCPKSAKILHAGCEYIRTHNDWSEVNLGAIALLASGDPAYASLVQTKMRAGILDAATLDLYKTGDAGVSAWNAGYKGWTMAEYFLATGDATVLPTIEAYAIVSARGRSTFGTFGHGCMSERKGDGSLHGPASGYGPMNQATLPNIISMILAKKCGVSHPEIDPAIAVASNFYSFYCDKGLIPYGEHVPSLTANEDNGRQALAAVMFSFDPTKNHQTNYFCRMAMASGDQRENGHTGPFFGYLWEPLGVNIGGAAAMADYFHDLAWWYDLNRRWDDSFAYVEGDGSPADLTYRGWTITPALMLHFAVPQKILHITGKNLSPALELTSAERAESLAASKFTLEHAATPKTTAELTAALGSFSPAIRNNWAAGYLAADPNHPSVAQLSAWATGTDVRLAEGACATLGFLKDPASTPALTSLLSSPNRSLRILASQALDDMGESARPATVGMLNAVIANQAPLDPMSADPLQEAQSQLANGLFYDNTGLLAKSFTGYDRALILDAVRVLMRAPDSWSRRCLYTILDMLTFEEIQELGQDLLDATQYKAPANGMYSKSIRIAGSQVLAKWRVVEGIPIVMDLLEIFQWGKDWFQGQELNALLDYGGSLNFMPGPDLDIYNRISAIEDFWLDKAGPTDEHVVTARQIKEKMADDPAAQPLVYLLNQVPVANAAAFWVYENKSIGTSVGTVTASDVVTTDTLTYAITAGNTGGAFAINSATGVITVAGTLNHATSPSYNLTITVTDSGLLTATAAVGITVHPVNHGSNNSPVVNDQAFALSESSSIGSSVGSVVSSDPDAGDIRTYAITAGNTGTAFAINSLTGQLSVAGGLDFETKPSYVLTVAVTDGLLTDTAAVTITLTNVNDAPVAAPQSVTTAEDTAKTIPLQATDMENSPLTYAIVTPPVRGTLSGTAPNVIYTPSANYYGSDSFTFKANDSLTDSLPATISVTVTAVNDAPVATAQSVNTTADTAKTITLAATDAEGDTLAYATATQPIHGTLSGSAPNMTYTPSANYNGPDGFTFKANDGTLDSAAATVAITVTSLTGLPLPWATVDIGTGMLAGAVSYSAGTFTQAGSGTLIGVTNDTFRFTYQALSGDGEISARIPAFEYTGNSSRVGVMIRETLAPGSKYVLMGLTGDNGYRWSRRNATDATQSSTNYGTGTAPNFWVRLVRTGNTITGYTSADGTTWTQTNNTSALTMTTDAYIGLAVDSGSLTTLNTSQFDHVSVAGGIAPPVNDPPVATAQSVSTAEDTAKAIALAATDAEGADLTYSTVTQPAHGTLSGTAPNVTYMPAANFNGADSFTFNANDGTTDSAPATVTLAVTAVNDAPVADDAAFELNENSDHGTSVGTVTARDPDAGDTRTHAITAGNAGGAFAINSGTGQITVAGSLDFETVPSYDLTVTVTDSGMLTATAAVAITVNDVNEAPVAAAQSVSTAQDTARMITLAATDVDGDALTYVIETQPAHGSLGGTAPNVTYTPAANYNGVDSFTFIANDGIFDSAAATVAITVTAATRGSFSTWASSNSVTDGEAGDADHDGFTNVDEYTLGTDPHTPDVALLMPAPAAGDSPTLTFLARVASGTGYEGLTRIYDVQASADLAPGSWQNLDGYTHIVGAGQSVVVTPPAAPPHMFYRLSVRLE